MQDRYEIIRKRGTQSNVIDMKEITPEEISKTMKFLNKKRNEKLSPERRSEIARNAYLATKRAKKLSTGNN